MDNRHQEFLEDLENSQASVNFMADWLRSRGHEVTVPATRMAPTRGQWKDYVDGGDLFIHWDHESRLEVRHLGYYFGTRISWPHTPYFMVCDKRVFDDYDPKPFATIFINPPMTHAAMVESSTFDHWYVQWRKNKKRGDNERKQYYFAPMQYVKFFSLEGT